MGESYVYCIRFRFLLVEYAGSLGKLGLYKPDRVIPPSLHIAEFVLDLQWTIAQFAAAMGTTPDFWLNLQRNYDRWNLKIK